MWNVKVKDRGRDLVVHRVDRADEARQIQRVYHALGYPPEKVLIERETQGERRAA